MVYKGQWRGRDVAIKRMLYKEQIMKEVHLELICKLQLLKIPYYYALHLQVSIMSDLKHHNIIKLHGTASKDPHLYIVLGWFSVCMFCHAACMSPLPIYRTG